MKLTTITHLSTEGTPFAGSMNTAICDFWYASP